MYRYLALNKEGFNKKAGFLGIGDIAKESEKYTKKPNKDGEPETSFLPINYNVSNVATTAENMGVEPLPGFSPINNNVVEDSLKLTTTDTVAEPLPGFSPINNNVVEDSLNPTDVAGGEPLTGFSPLVNVSEGESTPAPSTVKLNNSEQGNTPEPTTKVQPLQVESPTEPEEMLHNPEAAKQIDMIPGQVQDPNAELLVQSPTQSNEPLHVNPVNPDESYHEAPLTRLPVKDPEALDPNPEPISIIDDIFSAYNLRNNVLPGAGIAAGIGGLAGALMKDSNPLATALGTGAGAGAGTLLWDYLSRNKDTLKYIKDFLDWSGKNLWEGADGHVKYLAPALGGLAGLLISK